MQILNDVTIPVNPVIDAIIDATDTGYRMGKEDGENAVDQRGAAYFYPGSPAWHAYNEGYALGSLLYTARTGIVREVFTARRDGTVSNERFSALLADGDDYVPFQHPKEAYADVWMAEQRDDWVGD